MGVFRALMGILLVVGLTGCGGEPTDEPPRTEQDAQSAAPVFVQTGEGLTALDGDTGTTRWQTELPWPPLFDNESVGNPIVTLDDGTLLAVAEDGLRALDPGTGTEKWRARVPSTSGLDQTFPILTAVDDVVLLSMEEILHAFDRTSGELRWRAENTVLLATGDGSAFAYDREIGQEAVTSVDLATGKPRWRAELATLLPDHFPTDVDGAVATPEAVVILPGNTDVALGLDPVTGAVRWTVVPRDADGIPLTDIAEATAVNDQVVFTGNLGDDVDIAAHDLDDGERRWALTGTDFPAEELLLTQEGMVGVVGPSGGDLDARDLATGRSLWTVQSTGTYWLAAIGDGVVYAGSRQDSELTAFAMDDGTELWTTAAPGRPMVRGGEVYGVGGGDVLGEKPLTVTAVDARTGESRWRTELGRGNGFIELLAG
ncbi:outer membrane protein assembly factor BamB family protein [Actinophytocola sediminis]